MSSKPENPGTEPPVPDDEALRQFELEQYDIVDSEADSQFDDLTKLAAYICETEVALVTFIDRERQWFKSKVGTEISETSRQVAFCAHAIVEPAMMVVPNATEDARFASNPLVTGPLHIRFYAGAPLININGYALGTLCVLDSKPHQLTDLQQDALMALARLATSLLEQRRDRKELVRLIAERDDAQRTLEQFEETVEQEHAHLYDEHKADFLSAPLASSDIADAASINLAS